MKTSPPTASRAGRTLAALLGLLLLCSCESNQSKKEARTESQSARLEASPAPPPKPPKPIPWFVGKWKAEGKALVMASAESADREERKKKRSSSRAKNEKKVELPKAPANNGKDLNISLSISESKEVSGSVILGSTTLALSGILDEEVLRATLQTAWTRGTLVATRKGDEFEARLQISQSESSRKGAPLASYKSSLSLQRLRR